MAKFDTTILVYVTTDDAGAKNRVLGYFPTRYIDIPPRSKSTITWQANDSASGYLAPKIDIQSIQAAGKNSDRVAIVPGATSSQFVITIDNLDSTVTDAGVTFQATTVDAGTPPVIINGEGTIRNKGTSIYLSRSMIAFLFIGGLVAGAAIAWTYQKIVLAG
jgi:hypothetical protein